MVLYGWVRVIARTPLFFYSSPARAFQRAREPVPEQQSDLSRRSRRRRRKHAARWTPARFRGWRWPTVFARLPPSRFALWRDASPRQEGHTILSRAGGPDLLLLEEPVGSLLKNEEVVPILHRADTMEPRCKIGVARRGCDAGAAVFGGKRQRNEHAATRRSARGLGAEPAGREANVFCFTA